MLKLPRLRTAMSRLCVGAGLRNRRRDRPWKPLFVTFVRREQEERKRRSATSQKNNLRFLSASLQAVIPTDYSDVVHHIPSYYSFLFIAFSS